MKIIPLLLCSLIGYAWSISIQNTKSTQNIVSLDSVLENLIIKAKLDSLNDLTQEECEQLQRTYSTTSHNAQTQNSHTNAHNSDESYTEEQSCYYVAIQNLKATTTELISTKRIATDTHSLDSILRYKIIAYLSSTNLHTLSDVLGFEVPYSLQDVENVCHRLDGLEFEASCNLYMQIFDKLAHYVAQEHNLPQKAIQDYHKAFETRTQNALEHLEQESLDMP